MPLLSAFKYKNGDSEFEENLNIPQMFDILHKNWKSLNLSFNLGLASYHILLETSHSEVPSKEVCDRAVMAVLARFSGHSDW